MRPEQIAEQAEQFARNIHPVPVGTEQGGTPGAGGPPLRGDLPALVPVFRLSPAQEEAAKVWAAAYEHRQTPTAPVKQRLWASDILRLGQAKLTPPEVAILDMLVGKGRDLASLAEQTGRTKDHLRGLLNAALTRLARALEAKAAEDDAAGKGA